mmetsp:Transcript_47086/g.139081  ORF Transcript_47086/g.139081 Transcript_47086/m.139081 type:complete len:115 (-) Transcript_47086:29-373(-)
MARTFAMVLALLVAPAAAKYTVNDKIYAGGNLVAEGTAIAPGCQSANDVSSFKVCGCNVKVVAHLMTECQTYKQYDTTIGTCNCANSGCDEKSLTSGYSEKFEWNAASFEIVDC